MPTEQAAEKRYPVISLVESEDGRVYVKPTNRQAFCLTFDQSVQACTFMEVGYAFISQVADLREALGSWLSSRMDQIKAAYISMRRSHEILFIVVQKSVSRDSELAEDLTTLDIEIANDEKFNLLRVEVLALPDAPMDGIAAFLTPDNVMQYAKS